MSDQKTGRNTGRFAPGFDPRRSGGVRGRSGRKPNDFIAECQRLADAVALPKIAAHLEKADPEDGAWRWCVEYVSKYVKSEAPKHVELEHTGRIVIREKREPRVLIADN